MACLWLDICRAGFANEGVTVHEPEPAALLTALKLRHDGHVELAETREWTIVTNRSSTARLLRDAECEAELVGRGADDYIGSFEPEA